MASRDELMDLLTRAEQLDPELKPWVIEDGPIGPMLKHPLVQDLMLRQDHAAHINAMYAQKKKALKEAIASERWYTVVFLHERPWRVDALAEHVPPDFAEYSQLVASVWMDTENVHENRDTWKMILKDTDSTIMDEEEHTKLASLPDEIPVFRGFNGCDDGVDGFSWTLDKTRAAWFAQRFASHRGEAFLASGTIHKADVTALFLGRGENEIVALPGSVTNITIVRIPGEE